MIAFQQKKQQKKTVCVDIKNGIGNENMTGAVGKLPTADCADIIGQYHIAQSSTIMLNCTLSLTTCPNLKGLQKINNQQKSKL